MSSLDFIGSIINEACGFAGYSVKNTDYLLNGSESETYMRDYNRAIKLIFSRVNPNPSTSTFPMQKVSQDGLLFLTPPNLITLKGIRVFVDDKLVEERSTDYFEWGFINGTLEIRRHRFSWFPYTNLHPVIPQDDPKIKGEFVYINHEDFSDIEGHVRQAIIYNIASSLCSRNNKPQEAQINASQSETYIRMALEINGKRHGNNNSDMFRKSRRFPFSRY